MAGVIPSGGLWIAQIRNDQKSSPDWFAAVVYASELWQRADGFEEDGLLTSVLKGVMRIFVDELEACREST